MDDAIEQNEKMNFTATPERGNKINFRATEKYDNFIAQSRQTADKIKIMAMQFAIQAVRDVGSGDLVRKAVEIEAYLRDEAILASEDSDDRTKLLRRAEDFNRPHIAIEFSERNFTAAIQLIVDLAEHIRGK